MGAGGEGALLDAPLEWFDLHLRSSSSTGRHRRVSLYVQGEQPGWQEHPDWPPSAVATAWFLQPDGGLGTDLPPDSPPDSHPYDPADPTPSVGGIGMLTGGIVDNSALEARPDVLVYTSEPLTEPLLLTGAITATIELASSIDHTDVFVRLCDVDGDGRSVNVCDGLQRFTPATIERDSDGVFTAVVELWPTAHRFAVDHRIRVQVSGGAHPVYGRNLGTDEPPATATTLRSAMHTVFHDPVHPSKVVLPHAVPTA
jgi:putative CocE/NonD family hydrolase